MTAPTERDADCPSHNEINGRCIECGIDMPDEDDDFNDAKPLERKIAALVRAGLVVRVSDLRDALNVYSDSGTAFGQAVERLAHVRALLPEDPDERPRMTRLARYSRTAP